MPSVLHVTDRWGGGIATVVQQYVEATPGLDHFLVCADNEWQVRDRRADLFARRWELPAGRLQAVRTIARLVDENDIDVVHAHSSHGGALVRLRRLPARVVYTPNAFAVFARKGSREWLFGQAERLLGLRSIVFAAAGEDELRQAQKLSRRSQVVRIVNLPDQFLQPSARFRTPFDVVMAGRISPQKDPEFFAATAIEARRAGRPYRFRWLGDGDADARSILVDAGVEVTGWLSLQELHGQQARAQVYLHTARYEGSCLSVLDAAALGLPSIGRPVPGVADVPWLRHVSTPAQALSELDRLVDEKWWASCAAASLTGIAEHNPSNLRAQLMSAYGLCSVPSPH